VDGWSALCNAAAVPGATIQSGRRRDPERAAISGAPITRPTQAPGPGSFDLTVASGDAAKVGSGNWDPVVRRRDLGAPPADRRPAAPAHPIATPIGNSRCGPMGARDPGADRPAGPLSLWAAQRVFAGLTVRRGRGGRAPRAFARLGARLARKNAPEDHFGTLDRWGPGQQAPLEVKPTMPMIRKPAAPGWSDEAKHVVLSGARP